MKDYPCSPTSGRPVLIRPDGRVLEVTTSLAGEITITYRDQNGDRITVAFTPMELAAICQEAEL